MIRKASIALAIVGILAASLGIAVASPTVAHANPIVVPHTQHGCPAYAFCIYKRGGGWQGDTPIHWQFPPFQSGSGNWVTKSYNLSGMYGTHRVFNNGLSNAYGWENARLNTEYNGEGKTYTITPGKFVDVRDMTPWNSITLLHS